MKVNGTFEKDISDHYPVGGSSEELSSEELFRDKSGIVEFCNIVGFEEFALIVDPNSSYKKVLQEHEELLPEILGRDFDTQSCNEQEAKAEVFRRIMHMSILNYVYLCDDDEFISDFEGGVTQLTALKDGFDKELRNNIDESRKAWGKKPDYFTENILPMLEEEGEKNYKTAVEKLRPNLIGDLITRPIRGKFEPFGNYKKSAENSFMRVVSTGVTPNCVSYSARALSLMYNFGVPKEDMRLVLNGYHASVLYRINKYLVYIFDPRPSELIFKDIAGDLAIVGSFFSEYEISDITNGNDFIAQTEHFGTVANFTNDSPESSSRPHFLSPEDGLIASIYMNLAYVSLDRYKSSNSENDLSDMERYMDIVALFDPQNTLLARLRSI